MNDQHRAEVNPGIGDRVIVVGAGPVGAAAALLLADYGVPVTLLERYTEPHTLPRAVHLDDEVARTLGRIDIGEGFLARSRSCSGLRLLDAAHRVMAEFRREHEVGVHGFPQANMFHQPDLEELMFARIGQHPLIDLRRGAEVCGMDGAPGPLTADPVRVLITSGALTVLGTPIDLSQVNVRLLRRCGHRRPHHPVAELLPQHAAARRQEPTHPVHQRAHRRACQPAR